MNRPVDHLAVPDLYSPKRRQLQPLQLGVAPSFFPKAAVFAFAVVASFGGLLGGPALGDHEAIVAQAARDMRLSGDWLVPHFLGTPFIRKPPLPVWLVAGASYLVPPDAATGLPVTAAAARLPSALAAFGTIMLLWGFTASAFGAGVGVTTAMIGASSIGLLLYAGNATAEMLLTFWCTWAVVHFWYATNSPTLSRRFLHLLFFYLALGAGMMAKGPAPLPLVAVPLAVWWYTNRPLQIIARRRGRRAVGLAGVCFVSDLLPRTIHVFTRLWLVPGLVVFSLIFVPWMLAVAARYPYAWDFWDWHYLQRVDGEFGESGRRNVFYYLPVLGGLVLPWTILSLEAAVAPWVTRYARSHRPLLYAGLWTLTGAVIMSLMDFKKPYYVLPVVPGLMVLIGFVAHRFFLCRTPIPGARLTVALGLLLTVLAVPVAAVFLVRDEDIELSWTLFGAAVPITALFLSAAVVYLKGAGAGSLVIIAVSTVLSFYTVWYRFGTMIDNIDPVAALNQVLEENDVPPDARIIWVDQRPDARLAFYFNRRSEHLITPAEVLDVATKYRRPREEQKALALLAVERAKTLLKSTESVYLIVERANYERWRAEVEPFAQIVGSAGTVLEKTPYDWLILSNKAL